EDARRAGVRAKREGVGAELARAERDRNAPEARGAAGVSRRRRARARTGAGPFGRARRSRGESERAAGRAGGRRGRAVRRAGWRRRNRSVSEGAQHSRSKLKTASLVTWWGTRT